MTTIIEEECQECIDWRRAEITWRPDWLLTDYWLTIDWLLTDWLLTDYWLTIDWLLTDGGLTLGTDFAEMPRWLIAQRQEIVANRFLDFALLVHLSLKIGSDSIIAREVGYFLDNIFSIRHDFQNATVLIPDSLFLNLSSELGGYAIRNGCRRRTWHCSDWLGPLTW